MELYSSLMEREKRHNKFMAAVMGAEMEDSKSDERVVSLDTALTEFGGIAVETVG